MHSALHIGILQGQRAGDSTEAGCLASFAAGAADCATGYAGATLGSTSFTSCAVTATFVAVTAQLVKLVNQHFIQSVLQRRQGSSAAVFSSFCGIVEEVI